MARKILECLKLPARAPPLEPAAADSPDLGQAEDDCFDPSLVHNEPSPESHSLARPAEPRPAVPWPTLARVPALQRRTASAH